MNGADPLICNNNGKNAYDLCQDRTITKEFIKDYILCNNLYELWIMEDDNFKSFAQWLPNEIREDVEYLITY